MTWVTQVDKGEAETVDDALRRCMYTALGPEGTTVARNTSSLT